MAIRYWSAATAYAAFPSDEWSEVILMMYKMLIGCISGYCQTITFTQQYFIVHYSSGESTQMALLSATRTVSLRTAFDLITKRDSIISSCLTCIEASLEQNVYIVHHPGDVYFERP